MAEKDNEKKIWGVRRRTTNSRNVGTGRERKESAEEKEVGGDYKRPEYNPEEYEDPNPLRQNRNQNQTQKQISDRVRNSNVEYAEREMAETQLKALISTHLQYMLGIFAKIRDHNDRELNQVEDLQEQIKDLSSILYKLKNTRLGMAAVAAVLDSAETITQYISGNITKHVAQKRFISNIEIVNSNENYIRTNLKRLLKYTKILGYGGIVGINPFGYALYNYWSEFCNTLTKIIEIYTSFGIATTSASIYFTVQFPQILQSFIEQSNNNSNFLSFISLLLKQEYNLMLSTWSSNNNNNQSLALVSTVSNESLILYEPNNSNGYFNNVIAGLNVYIGLINNLMNNIPIARDYLLISSLDVVTQNTMNKNEIYHNTVRAVDMLLGGKPTNTIKRISFDIETNIKKMILETSILFDTIDGAVDILKLITYILLFLLLLNIILDIWQRGQAYRLKQAGKNSGKK